eukprot:326663-Rhodomonas_salina.1
MALDQHWIRTGSALDQYWSAGSSTGTARESGPSSHRTSKEARGAREASRQAKETQGEKGGCEVMRGLQSLWQSLVPWSRVATRAVRGAARRVAVKSQRARKLGFNRSPAPLLTALSLPCCAGCVLRQPAG